MATVRVHNSHICWGLASGANLFSIPLSLLSRLIECYEQWRGAAICLDKIGDEWLLY